MIKKEITRAYTHFKFNKYVFSPKSYTKLKKEKDSSFTITFKNADVTEIMNEVTMQKCMNVFSNRRISEKNKRLIIMKIYVIYCFNLYQVLLDGGIISFNKKILAYITKQLGPTGSALYRLRVVASRGLYNKTKNYYRGSISNNLRKQCFRYEQENKSKYKTI